MLADIPGLIEGAHEGLGLGDRFLGHVERCRVLLHLVDAGSEHAGRAYRTVRHELVAYGGGLAEKPEIVALSRADVADVETLKLQIARLKRAMRSWGPVPDAGTRHAAPLILSAATNRGVTDVLRAVGPGNRWRKSREGSGGETDGVATLRRRCCGGRTGIPEVSMPRSDRLERP